MPTAVIILVLWSFVPAIIAVKKGRSCIGFFFLSLLISPLITTIIVLCLKSKKAGRNGDKPQSSHTSDNPDVDDDKAGV